MFVQWRWYYNVPSLSLWVLLLFMVVVPNHNRHRQAWLILLLPLLAAGFSLLTETLIPGADSFGQFVTALAVAWTSVWLLGPWLQHGKQVRRLLQVCAVMVAVGAVAYLGFFGAWVSSDITWPIVGCWAVCSISLVAAAALTGLCCRGDCRPLPLVFWPMLWMPVASSLCVGVFVISLIVIGEGPGSSVGESLAFMIIPAVMASVFLAGMLYIFDLPVMLLRIFSPCYRERFRGLFCPAVSRMPVAVTVEKLETQSASGNPFGV